MDYDIKKAEEAFLAANAEYKRRLAADVLPHNRRELFGALRQLGAAAIVVSYDGSGDDGFIEDAAVTWSNDATCSEADTPTRLKGVRVRLRTLPRNRVAEVSEDEVALPALIEQTVFQLLELAADGWENDVGAYGEISFYAADESVTVRHSAREISVNTTEVKL